MKGKLYVLMGKSASGKDTVYRQLLARDSHLSPLVIYTTRPMRDGETEGKTYHYTDAAGLQKLRAAGRVIECRTYHTMLGDWNYFTVDDGRVGTPGSAYLVIGTPESYRQLRYYYGTEIVRPLYIELEDGERLERALKRERAEQNPHYDELCRRFLADQADFAEEKLGQLGIGKRYENQDADRCAEAILADLAAERAE